MSDSITTVAELVAAREARGLGPDDVMRQLKLAPKQLRALEQGDWSALPGHAFVRGVLRGYGRMLGVDVEPLIEAMSATVHTADLRPAASLDQPLPSRSMLGFGSGGSGSRFAWVLLLAIGVLALALFFGGSNLGGIGSWLARERAPEAASGGASRPASAEGGAEGTTTEAVPITPLPPARPGATEPVRETVPAPALPGSSGSVSPAAGADTVAAAPAAGGGAGEGAASRDGPAAGSAPVLRLSFERESWLEAKRDGKVLMSGVQSAGSSRELPIEGSTAVVIGNAASVRAEFAGKPLDLAVHIRGSVARLTLP